MTSITITKTITADAIKIVKGFKRRFPQGFTSAELGELLVYLKVVDEKIFQEQMFKCECEIINHVVVHDTDGVIKAIKKSVKLL